MIIMGWIICSVDSENIFWLFKSLFVEDYYPIFELKKVGVDRMS